MAYTDPISGEVTEVLKTPTAGPRKDKGTMTATELHTLFDGLVDSATQYTDGELSPERAKATDYYFARPFGNEEKGRSQVVLSEVRDGVLGVLPPLLRTVFGPGVERVVEFVPKRAETVLQAEQATDYINYVFAQDNAGFLQTLAVLKDGLIRKLGVFKWGWDKTSEVETHKIEGVTQTGLELLAGDDEVTLTSVTKEEDGNYTVECTTDGEDGRLKIYTIPPEEFIFNREARDIDEALFVGHRTEKTTGELIAMGIEEKIIKEHGGPASSLFMNAEAIARTPTETGGPTREEAGDANVMNAYVEGYARVDYDGNGKAELRRICALGPENYIVSNDPCAAAPFAIFCPDPEPHSLLGQSWADRLMDMQRVKSFVFRANLDSLAASIHPRTVYKEGDANLADILNPAIGAPIRTKTGPGAVLEFSHTYTGKEAFPVLQYCDEIVERRTGQNKGAIGLDADALQSTGKEAVNAAVTSSQAQQEMLVRIFAEGTLKPLFKGMLKLLIAHQPRARMVRLRGHWVDVDPRGWDADMDVEVNVALGSGAVEDKIATLELISEKQGAVMQELGPDNPIVGLVEFANTLSEIAALRGRKDTSKYFKKVTQEQLDALAAQAAQQPPPETPEQTIAKAQLEIEKMKAEAHTQNEQMKAQKDVLLRQADLGLKMQEMKLVDAREREKAMREDDRERDKNAADIELKRIDMEMKYQAKIAEQELTAAIEAARATSQAGPGEAKPASKGRTVDFRRDDQGNIAGWDESPLE